MGDIFASGGVSSFPSSLDSYTTQLNDPAAITFSGSSDHASKVNNLAQALVNMETYVGITRAAGRILFQGASNLSDDAKLFWDNTNKFLGLGLAAPTFPLHVQCPASGPGSAAQQAIALFQNTLATGAVAIFEGVAHQATTQYRRGDTSLASPTAVQQNEVIGQINAIGYAATGWAGAGSCRIQMTAAETFTDTTIGGYMTFATILIGAAALVERMRIMDNGNIGIGALGAAAFGTSAVGVLSIANGTEHAAGAADTVQFYSIDDVADHTIPAFYCEGTNVLATGQADSVSSVRVKMRINGTTVTLLGI